MSAERIVITGGTSGIGRATASAFAQRGYRSLVLGRRAWDGPGLEGATHARVDVRDGAALRQVIQEYERAEGPVSLLVNNAGIMPLGKIDSQDPAEWTAAFEVNTLAVLHASQAVLPGMIRRGTGTIMSVSSIAGRNVYANHTAYSGTKFAVHAMMESMRKEHAAHGIRFTTIAPGIVDTDLLSSVTDTGIAGSYQATKDRLDGGLTAEDIAENIVSAYELPQRVCVRELVIAPTSQES